jgi:hypothetical protein
VSRRLLEGTRAAARALRGFLAGFTGMPSARLPEPRACCEGGAADAAREALGERAARRPTCC